MTHLFLWTFCCPIIFVVHECYEMLPAVKPFSILFPSYILTHINFCIEKWVVKSVKIMYYFSWALPLILYLKIKVYYLNLIRIWGLPQFILILPDTTEFYYLLCYNREEDCNIYALESSIDTATSGISNITTHNSCSPFFFPFVGNKLKRQLNVILTNRARGVIHKKLHPGLPVSISQ